MACHMSVHFLPSFDEPKQIQSLVHSLIIASNWLVPTLTCSRKMERVKTA